MKNRTISPDTRTANTTVHTQITTFKTPNGTTALSNAEDKGTEPASIITDSGDDEEKEKEKETKDLSKVEKTVVELGTCQEYSDVINSMSDKELSEYLQHNRASEKKLPPDAMQIEAFDRLSDQEKCTRLNKMSIINQKSHLFVMVANGYGFTWTKMVEHALGSCQIIKDPLTANKKQPKFIIKDETNPSDLSHDFLRSEGDKKVLYIDRGKRPDTKTIKTTFTEPTITMINKIFGSLSNIEKSKVLEAILIYGLKEINDLYEEEKLMIKYRPLEEEPLQLGPR